MAMTRRERGVSRRGFLGRALAGAVGLHRVARAGADEPVEEPFAGTAGRVGCGQDPQRVRRLQIREPGVYENYLVDGRWVQNNLVKIHADEVTLRNCEIRHARHNGVLVNGRNVVLENCHIHHLLRGTFDRQHDAHGVTGRPTNLVIRNCEINYVSGDAVQFDPGRRPWDNVVIERCTLWTGPLPDDAAGFRRGQRPGENAVDTKQSAGNPRSRLTVRRCLMYGWGDGQIDVQAALNLKDHVRVEVIDSIIAESEIAFRLRGDVGGGRGGARVTIRNCAVYDSEKALRLEDGIENLKVLGLGIGPGVQRKQQIVAGQPRGMIYRGEFTPPSYERAVRCGWQRRDAPSVDR